MRLKTLHKGGSLCFNPTFIKNVISHQLNLTDEIESFIQMAGISWIVVWWFYLDQNYPFQPINYLRTLHCSSLNIFQRRTGQSLKMFISEHFQMRTCSEMNIWIDSDILTSEHLVFISELFRLWAAFKHRFHCWISDEKWL